MAAGQETFACVAVNKELGRIGFKEKLFLRIKHCPNNRAVFYYKPKLNRPANRLP
jgi:hypothetical protein